jgi:hypothetical protein
VVGVDVPVVVRDAERRRQGHAVNPLPADDRAGLRGRLLVDDRDDQDRVAGQGHIAVRGHRPRHRCLRPDSDGNRKQGRRDDDHGGEQGRETAHGDPPVAVTVRVARA